MWMAQLMEGEVVGELPAYASAFEKVHQFILKALNGDTLAATELFQKYLAGDMPQELLSISRRWLEAEQGADVGDTLHLHPLAA
jgi:hypothetical protein